METSAVANDNIKVLTVKPGRQTCLAPRSIGKRGNKGYKEIFVFILGNGRLSIPDVQNDFCSEFNNAYLRLCAERKVAAHVTVMFVLQ